MTSEKTEQITKRVEFKEADDARQIATGVVMVPNKVDLQGDFERPDTIRDLAEGFMTRLSSGDSEGGIMHAAFPGHSTLVENSVLDQSREIGGREYPAGTWTQSWKFTDNELWTLVRDGILSGYSIGADQVEWSDPMEQGDLPSDVTVAEGYPGDELVWELQSGAVKEVSTVDIPAVPDAEILQTKDGAEKRIADYLGDREGFLEEMADRGHSEGEAERLWNYLQRAVDEEDVEAASGWLARAKAFFTKGPGAPDEQAKRATDNSAAGDGGTSDGGTHAADAMTDKNTDDEPLRGPRNSRNRSKQTTTGSRPLSKPKKRRRTPREAMMVATARRTRSLMLPSGRSS
ncbi:XkdF-like putative serine protease domain-containing protein [Halobacteriaceae archaeon GCM10025711]